ncbi:MAG: transglycosylase SLT domain-containing protein [Thermodesulfovibrionales bacterium]|nr:transglycosylase SLT domain-containing protein [Thermodesulfovibrionales bacterium]
MIRHIFVLALALILPMQAMAAKTSDTGMFGKAVALIEEGDHREALRLFKKVDKSLPYVRDYIMYHKARAQFALGRETDAGVTIRELLRRYPGSPVRQHARRLELDIRLAGDWDKAFGLIESYISEYPKDNETRFFYAERLNMRGRFADAQKHYRHIYISADKYSEMALALLEDRELSYDEKLERARNLSGRHLYAQAEPVLFDLILADTERDQKKVRQLYAQALFRQKKYTQAIPYLIEQDNRYDAALAYIRSGDRESFHRTVLTMVADKDKDAPRLLVALAEEARRNGEPDKALEYLDDSVKLFPKEKEDALWSKGWLYYRIGMMEEAGDTFYYMYRKYKEDKYAYWAARAKEKTGADPDYYLRKVSGEGYYSFLAMLRSGGKPDNNGKGGSSATRQNRRLRRADILLSEGLYEEAAIELRAVARKTRRYKELLDIGHRMVKAGEYDVAQRLMNRVPGSRRPDEILFPLAFWPTVSEVAGQYSMDPYLMLSLMREESLFDTEAFSPSGAMGLMQLMPSTARRTARAAGISLENEGELFLADMNIRIGTHYFSGLVNGFGSVTPGIAAYNAGERVVRQWLDNGGYSSYDEFVEDIPYKETREYVKRIMRSYYRYHSRREPPSTLPEYPGIL